MIHDVISLYSSVVERQSCKLKVLGSIPSGGLYLLFMLVLMASFHVHVQQARADTYSFPAVINPIASKPCPRLQPHTFLVEPLLFAEALSVGHFLP